VSFVLAVEVALGLVGRARAGSGLPSAGPALAPVAADAEHAARLALAASVAAGNPLSQRQLMTRFGLTRTRERKVRESVAAESNGHPAE
jgi:hypothetical protein